MANWAKRFGRQPTGEPISVELAMYASQTWETAIVTDVNSRGLGLTTTRHFPPGTSLRIRAASSECRAWGEVEAIVRWCRSVGTGGYRVGLLIRKEDREPRTRSKVSEAYWDIQRTAEVNRISVFA